MNTEYISTPAFKTNMGSFTSQVESHECSNNALSCCTSEACSLDKCFACLRPIPGSKPQWITDLDSQWDIGKDLSMDSEMASMYNTNESTASGCSDEGDSYSNDDDFVYDMDSIDEEVSPAAVCKTNCDSDKPRQIDW